MLMDCFQQMQGDLEEIFKSTHSPFLGSLSTRVGFLLPGVSN
jgi:hypothetical protein